MTTPPNQTHWTVEQASAWLTLDGRPMPLDLLRSLGKDCSLVCRIHKIGWVDVPVIGRAWATERGYTREVLREVFANHPATRDALARLEGRAA